MALLQSIEVSLISILTEPHKPANGKSVILKNDTQLLVETGVIKSNTKGLLTVTVMTPEVDSDGDYATREEIEKAAHAFLAKTSAKSRIDENHCMLPNEKVSIAESYTDDSGSWKMVLDISQDPILMAKAEKGEITGVSIFGKAVAKSNKTIVEKFSALFTKILKNNQEEIMTKEEIIELIRKTLKEDYGLEPKSTNSENDLSKEVSELKKMITELSKNRSTELGSPEELTYEQLLQEPQKLEKMKKENYAEVEKLREKFITGGK